MSYATHFSTVETPQTEPIPGKAMVPNSAGGFAFAVDDWTRLDRFLVLGAEGGTYYATEKALTVENAQSVLRCCAADYKRTVDRIVEISEAGRAPKNDPAIFALAICAGFSKGLASNGTTPADVAAYMVASKTRAYASEMVPRVCRTGTHLFQFAEAVEKFRGWGRALVRGVRNWYLGKEPKQLAYQVVKYQQRNGWSHRDLLRLCHAKAEGERNTVLRWAVGKIDGSELIAAVRPETPDDSITQILPILGFELLKKATDKKEVARLIREFDMPRECVPTQFLTDPEVLEALLEKMPMTAMVRNLATMTRVGLLAPMSAAVGKVVSELANVERIRKSRLHPIALLNALLTYKQGHGERGKSTWSPVPQVVDALDGAFYTAFGNVEPTNKRWMLAMDVSGSMASGTIAGMPGLTPRVGSAAMALVTAAVEKQHCFMAFSDTFKSLAISPRQRLDDVCKAVDGMPFSATDCSLPMKYAMENRILVDAFVVYTDSETYAGTPHPCQALQQYRQKMGVGAKMIVVGMTSSLFTIADPSDGGMMDVVGWDSAAPTVMADFVRN